MKEDYMMGDIMLHILPLTTEPRPKGGVKGDKPISLQQNSGGRQSWPQNWILIPSVDIKPTPLTPLPTRIIGAYNFFSYQPLGWDCSL